MKSFIAAVCTIASLSFTVPSLSAADAAAGKATYSKKCTSCHGPMGEAKENVAKTLKVEMHSLGSKEVQAKSDAELKKDILEGTGKMKPVTGIDAKAADDIVAYLRTLKK